MVRLLSVADAPCNGAFAPQRPTLKFSTDGETHMRQEKTSIPVLDICAAMLKADPPQARESFQLRDLRRTYETMLAALKLSSDVRSCSHTGSAVSNSATMIVTTMRLKNARRFRSGHGTWQHLSRARLEKSCLNQKESPLPAPLSRRYQMTGGSVGRVTKKVVGHGY